jgi:LEA14-like dessication related protein
VNKLVYAAAGGIAVVAVAMFFLLGSGPVFPAGNQDRPQNVLLPPELTLKEVNATKIDDNTAKMRVVFTVQNPNAGTLVLDSIQYNVLVDGKQMAVGNMGTDQGLTPSAASQTVIVAGTAITMRDGDLTVEERNSSNSEAWDKMISGDASFVVSGTSTYSLTAALTSNSGENDFSLTFP